MEERGILHRDISLRNIILVEQDGLDVRKGVVIDFDYATNTNGPQSPETYYVKVSGFAPL